jgi:hypothetical protein
VAQRGYDTNLASEFYVLSVLYRLGLDASLTLGNKKRVDIAVIVEEGRTITIDVKGVAGKMDWMLGNSPPHAAPNHYVILVCYEGKIADPKLLPRVWIVPSVNLTPHVKTARNGKTRYVPRKAFLESPVSGTFENAWHLLKSDGKPAAG